MKTGHSLRIPSPAPAFPGSSVQRRAAAPGPLGSRQACPVPRDSCAFTWDTAVPALACSTQSARLTSPWASPLHKALQMDNPWPLQGHTIAMPHHCCGVFPTKPLHHLRPRRPLQSAPGTAPQLHAAPRPSPWALSPISLYKKGPRGHKTLLKLPENPAMFILPLGSHCPWLKPHSRHAELCPGPTRPQASSSGPRVAHLPDLPTLSCTLSLRAYAGSPGLSPQPPSQPAPLPSSWKLGPLERWLSVPLCPHTSRFSCRPSPRLYHRSEFLLV